MLDKAFATGFYWIVCDESTYATDNTQLLIFFEALMITFALWQSTPMCKAIFEALSNAIDKMGPRWDWLCAVTMDRAPATGECKDRGIQRNG